MIIFLSVKTFYCITINRIVDVYDGINPSNHSMILLSFTFILDVRISTSQTCSIINSNCLWGKVSIEDIANYSNVLNRVLDDIDLDCELFACANFRCSYMWY